MTFLVGQVDVCSSLQQKLDNVMISAFDGASPRCFPCVVLRVDAQPPFQQRGDQGTGILRSKM